MSDTTEKSTMALSLDDMMPRITEQVAAELRDRAVRALEYRVNEAVGKAVEAYIAERIIPEVEKELADRHEEIRAVFVGAVGMAVVQASDLITTSTAKHMAGTAGDQFIGELMAKLFRGY